MNVFSAPIHFGAVTWSTCSLFLSNSAEESFNSIYDGPLSHGSDLLWVINAVKRVILIRAGPPLTRVRFDVLCTVRRTNSSKNVAPSRRFLFWTWRKWKSVKYHYIYIYIIYVCVYNSRCRRHNRSLVQMCTRKRRLQSAKCCSSWSRLCFPKKYY